MTEVSQLKGKSNPSIEYPPYWLSQQDSELRPRKLLAYNEISKQ